MPFVMREGLRALGTVAGPVTALLLVGKVQGIVQGASKEGIAFMGLRRTGAQVSARAPWLPKTKEARGAILGFMLLSLCVLFFEMGFLCEPLAVLELTV